MGFLLGLMTAILVLDCLVLILLVLIQLPKKESGAGLAFGAGATDALFGAGSGNVLTKVTKYAAGAFFILAILLAVLQRNYQHRSTSEFERQLQSGGKPAATQPAGTLPAPVAPPAATPAPGTNSLLSADPSATNPPAQPAQPTQPAEDAEKK